MAKLGKVSLTPTLEVDEGLSKFDVEEQVMQALIRTGLSPPKHPGGTLEDLDNELNELTNLDDTHLGDLLNKCSRWVGYADTRLAIADLQKGQAEAALDFVKARVRMLIKEGADGKKLTVADKDDLVTANDHVVEETKRYIYCESVYKYTRTIRDKVQRDWETVSRRITQRGQEIERMKRETNVAGVPVQQHSFRR